MNTRVWLIRFTDSSGTQHAAVHGHNAIADFRALDPSATAQELDVLALAELLAADRAFDAVVSDVQAHHRHVAERGGYTRLEMPGTRELCERFVSAEMDRTAALERCITAGAPA